MKNIVFFRISLALVGLLCSGGQANHIFPTSDEVKNIPNFTAALDITDSQPMRPMLFDLYTELFKTMTELFNSLSELNTDMVKRIARNANTDRTKLPENINVTIKYNNVTESHTQPNIYHSTISNSTHINDRLINNNTKQNNDTYGTNFYNLACVLSTWQEYSTIRKQCNKIVNKLYTIYTTLLPRSFMASIVPGIIRKYWLLRGIAVDTITGDVLLYVTLVVFCGMLLFVAFMTVKAIRQLSNSRRKLKPHKEDLLFYVV